MQNSAFGVMVAAAANKEDCISGQAPRALWPVLDKPMIGYVLKTVLECAAEDVSVAVAVGNEDNAISAYLKSFPSVTVIKIDSPEYQEWMKRFPNAPVIGCDMLFLKAETVSPLIRGEAALNGEEARGVHSQAELAEAAARMRDSIVLKWMEKGVRVADPHAVWIGPDVTLEPGVSVMPGAQLWGNTTVGAGSEVGPYCILRDAVLGRGVHLIANVIVEDSELKDCAKAGPFAYIREHTVLDGHSFAGKFVEIKKSFVGKGSKVPHLSYMGDAILGENVNIGAGSVTCNYDGENKYQTRIGDRCFVGSDTMMVAPVTLGDDSAVGAGSTITVDVPAGALAIGRARQRNIEGRALEKKKLKQLKEQ